MIKIPNLTNAELHAALAHHGACAPAVKWLGKKDLRDAVNEIRRLDWIGWMAYAMRASEMAAPEVVRELQHLVKIKREQFNLARDEALRCMYERLVAVRDDNPSDVQARELVSAWTETHHDIAVIEASISIELLASIEVIDFRPFGLRSTPMELSEFAKVIQSRQFVVLDTETTGLGEDAQAVQLAIIDAEGNTLVNTYIKPTVPVQEGAYKVHGIGDKELAGAPGWMQIEDAVLEALRDKIVVIYNANYDTGILASTARAAGSKALRGASLQVPVVCAMLAYAEHNGDWNQYRESWRWVKLDAAAAKEGIETPNSHDALADCLTTLALVNKVWGTPGE